MKSKLLLMVCMAHSVQAYICHAIIMRKFQPDVNRYHYVLGLGDFHDAIVPEDLVHRDAIKVWLEQPGNKGMRVITEDLNAPNVEGRSKMKGFALLPIVGSFLSGITDVVRAAGADAVNLEYRYGRLVAFSPLRHASKKISTIAAAQEVFLRDLIQEVEHELINIAQFSDNRILNAWYAAEAAKIRSAMKSLKWHTYANKTIAEYAATLHMPLRSYIDKHLLIFDRTILDMKIVHDIVANSHVHTTCIIAGGSHVDRAEVQLKRIGYEVVSRINPHSPFLIGFASFLLGGSMPAPYPIKLSELNSFLNKLPS